MQRIIVLLAIMELDILKNNWSDAQIVDVSYQKGTLLLALKDYQNIIYEYLFEKVFALSFENYHLRIISMKILVRYILLFGKKKMIPFAK